MSRRYKGYYPVSILAGRRRWQKTYSTQRLLLILALIIGGISLVTWFLYHVKGAGS